MKFTCQILLVCFLASLISACSYTVKIEDGKTAYDRKQFATSIPMLKKEINRAKLRTEKGKLAYLLADAYRRTGQDESALEWFRFSAENNGGAEALKGYAYTLKKLERYKEAAEAFKNLGVEIGSPYEYRKELTACTIAAEWIRLQPYSGMTVEAVPFNSPHNDFAPAFYADGQLVFTSDRSGAGGDDNYAWTGNKFMDLFFVDSDAASPQSFEPGLNTKGNEGTACFNSFYTEVYFVRAAGAYKGDDAYCKIYFSKKDPDTGLWGNAAPLPFQKEKINYVHPALSADGNTLYFACNDPEGWGGFDIYAVQRSNKTESGWDDPKILSRSVNTTGNELFPSMELDTLYFASDGHQGMGGLDIFRTWKSERTAWAPPQNLKSPVNSGADDFGLVVMPRVPAKKTTPLQTGDLIRSGYFTSNRPGGRGFDDIYRFDQRVPPPMPPKKDTTPVATPATAAKMVLEGYVLEKIFSTPGDPNSAVLGRKPLDGATVQIEFGGKKQNIKVKEDGFFTLVLTDNTDYNFVASMSEYLTNSTRFSTKGIAKDPLNPVQTFEIEIVLDRIYRDREIVLENIYYDYDKWDIRPDAEPTLNKLSEVLRQNPAIRIQLGSHTDCRGNDAYNEDLSQKRAQSAVNYLIGKGIDANRLSAVGYGESQPAADCACSRCTETEHQTNRRTTFRILE